MIFVLNLVSWVFLDSAIVRDLAFVLLTSVVCSGVCIFNAYLDYNCHTGTLVTTPNGDSIDSRNIGLSKQIDICEQVELC